MKKIKAIVLLIALNFMLNGCSSSIKVPDLSNTSESVAIKVLTDNQLIPTIVYDFSDLTNEGMIIKTDPGAGEKAEKNDRVIVYVSKGPAKIVSKDSRFAWWQTFGSDKDDWIFYAPYVEGDHLKIDLEYEIKSRYSIVFKEYGTAIVKGVTDITVPITIKKGMKPYSLKEAMTISIPLSDLGTKKPTSVKVMLQYEANGNEYTLNMEFTISW